MKRWFGFTATALLATLVCHAQTDLVQITVLTTATFGKQIALKNNSAQPVTAFVLEFRQHPARGGPDATTTFIYDSILNGRSQPRVEPGRSVSQAFGGDGTSSTSGEKIPMVSTLEFKSALFQDGSTFGDSTWALNLVQRRRLTNQFLAKAISVFEANPQPTTASLIEQFRTLDTTARAIADRQESAMAQVIYETVYGNLEADPRPGSVTNQLQTLKEKQAALLASFGGR